MSTYSEITSQLADQWVAAVEQAIKALPAATDSMKGIAPGFDLPDLTGLLPSAAIEGLPDAREVIEANFDVASRLLAAQRDFAVAMISSGSPRAEQA